MLNNHRPGRMAAFLCAVLVTGCASRPVPASLQQTALRNQLLQLQDNIAADEATRLAEAALEKSAALAAAYRAVWPPWLHNNLVNAGLRERGLCYHWANDLFAHLQSLNLQSLELHLAVARMDTGREHNAIVVTASRHPFAQGIVLDAWRHSGRLWSGGVATDKYPWQPLPRDRVAPELEKFFALEGPADDSSSPRAVK